MNQYKTRWMHTARVLCAVALVCAIGCTHAPPSLSPTGVADYTSTRVISGLDALMNVAIKAEALKPPLISTATTRRIVQYHQAAVKVVLARPAGWQTQVWTGLDGVFVTFNPAERELLAPYVALVKALMETK